MRLVRVGAISDADCCGYETKRCRGAAFSIGYTNGGADNAVRAREALFPSPPRGGKWATAIQVTCTGAPRKHCVTA